MNKPRFIYRKDEIVRLCKNKTVLHLGFIQHTLWREKIQKNEWLHGRIMEVAAKVVGVDYLSEEIIDIRKEVGCECLYGDVMKLDQLELDGSFDVIVCGELIEHLDNPGLFLDGIKRFYHNNTITILTTPNPWSRERNRLIGSGHLENEWLNEEHVAWYSIETLRHLLTRHGFNIFYAGYYFGDSRLNHKNISMITQVKTFFERTFQKEQHQDGLFFVATLDESEIPL